MKGYLFDTHVHTAESSACGEVAAEGVVARYRSLGYDGIIVTDHVNAYNFSKLGSTYDEQAENWLKGYRTAKAAAGDGFTVILGMEIRFLDYNNDYLVYGFDEGLIFTCDMAHFRSLEEFRPFADEHGLVIYQAHPFRPDMTVIDQTLLDGMEVYNGHGGHNSSNDIAYRWAEKYSLPMSSGSDFHREAECISIKCRTIPLTLPVCSKTANIRSNASRNKLCKEVIDTIKSSREVQL